jgi:Ca-activated chloride channel family protein
MMISPMLSFLAPGRLWLLLLIPALVGLYLLLYRRRAQRRKKQYGRSMLDFVVPRELPWKRHVAVGLSVLSLMTLTVAFAKPKSTVEVPRERATVVVTIDVSNSMMAQDVKPDRLTAAKAGAKQFVQSLPPKFNVSVVEFAGTATILLPPTTDHGAAEAAIQSMKLQPSTAIGEGIYTSLSALAEAPPDPSRPDSKPPGLPRPPRSRAWRSTPSPTARPTAISTSRAPGSRCPSTAGNWPRSPRSPAARPTGPNRPAN